MVARKRLQRKAKKQGAAAGVPLLPATGKATGSVAKQTPLQRRLMA